MIWWLSTRPFPTWWTMKIDLVVTIRLEAHHETRKAPLQSCIPSFHHSGQPSTLYKHARHHGMTHACNPRLPDMPGKTLSCLAWWRSQGQIVQTSPARTAMHVAAARTGTQALMKTGFGEQNSTVVHMLPDRAPAQSTHALSSCCDALRVQSVAVCRPACGRSTGS